MVNRKHRTVMYRRKREQRTHYPRRLHLLLSRKARLVVRITNTKTIIQLAQLNEKGDHLLLGIDSMALCKYGWPYSCKNVPSAYLAGFLFGTLAVKAGYPEAVLDTGFRTPKSKGRIFAAVKGALDAGMKVPHGEGIFPDEARLTGKHIQEYALSLPNKQQLQFAQYLKSGLTAGAITSRFEQVKRDLANQHISDSQIVMNPKLKNKELKK